MGEPNNSPEKDRKRGDEGVTLVNEWNWGRITVISLIIIFIVVIFTLSIVKNRKKKFHRSP
jgi:hypothetical protein